jgi:HAD superfamily hydrolase (TIGR01509 family)
MPLRVVCLDFDGVLADTENVHVAAWERTFLRLGWDIKPETCALAAEMDDRDFLASVFKKAEVVDGDVEGYVGLKQKLTRQILTDAPRLYPGAAALVRTLAERVRLALVSTTWRENMEAVLQGEGLLDAFEVMVGKEDVTEPKPSPQPYKKALKALGVSPRSALAIEDSSTGIQSALAAGLKVVAVGHRRDAGDWTQGAPFIESLRDTAAVLQLIGLK